MSKYSHLPVDHGHLQATTRCLEDLMKEIKANDQAQHSKEKPPLGIMPERLFEDSRIVELCRAIERQAESETPDYKLMHKWAEEICRKTM